MPKILQQHPDIFFDHEPTKVYVLLILLLVVLSEAQPLARANANDWFWFSNAHFGRMARLKAVWPKGIFQQ